MYLVINKCVTAVKVSDFSGPYILNRSTLDIGVLCYIGIVEHKEHSPEVWSIPSGTLCIWNIIRLFFFLLSNNIPTWACATSLLRFPDHTLLDTPHSVGLLWTSEQPVAQTASYTTQTQRSKIQGLSGIRTPILSIKRPQTYTLGIQFIVLEDNLRITTGFWLCWCWRS